MANKQEQPIATTFEIELDDMPPSLNNLYSSIEVNGRPRRVLSSEARAWKEAHALIIRTQGRIAGFSIAPGTLFSMTITLRAPNVLQWDLDGKSKLLIDAVCEAFGINDRHLFELRMSKGRGNTSVRVRIEAL